MPELSRFFGIVIYIYGGDHSPPHFHARYAGRKVSVDIRTLEIMEGRIHPRALGLVIEWATLHRAELLAAWAAVRRGATPAKIPPLG